MLQGGFLSGYYLEGILGRERVSSGLLSPSATAEWAIRPAIQSWGGSKLCWLALTGSIAKGTANRSGTDVDFFISLASDSDGNLEGNYLSLFELAKNQGWRPRKRNVAIQVSVEGLDVDLVVGRQQSALSSDHSLWRNRVGKWTKTNVATHILYVSQSGCANAIRILKLWRDQWKLELPSFLLELMVIRALQGTFFIDVADQVIRALQWIADNAETCRIEDPANTNNAVSDDLTQAEKVELRRAAQRALSGTWEALVR